MSDQILHKEEVLKELLLAAGNPEVTSLEAAEILGSLYDRAEKRDDVAAKSLIMDVWHRIEALKGIAATSIDLATVARQALEESDTRYEVLSSEHQELREAIKRLDRNHNLVDGMVDRVREDWEMDLLEAGFWYSYCPACEIIENSCETLDHGDHVLVEMFFDMLTGNYELPAVMLDELAEFMRSFVRRVQEEMAA